jgi:CBS domain-containing protein
MATALTVEHVMASNPITLDRSDPAADAAKLMRELDVGDVVLCDEHIPQGMVTDRDIVVRAVAADKNPSRVRLGDLAVVRDPESVLLGTAPPNR